VVFTNFSLKVAPLGPYMGQLVSFVGLYFAVGCGSMLGLQRDFRLGSTLLRLVSPNSFVIGP